MTPAEFKKRKTEREQAAGQRAVWDAEKLELEVIRCIIIGDDVTTIKLTIYQGLKGQEDK